jgi:DNA-binding response OmpR family regulator
MKCGGLMKKIMIVEDDAIISEELYNLLSNSEYEAKILEDFQNSKKEILNYNPDLLLLDINIPYINGEMLLKEIRKESNMPVIMVTSRNSETDEVLSMSYGADDYITKPYNPTILLLRISAIFKRIENKDNNLKYKDLTINLSKGILQKENQELQLTKNEMIIFQYLLNHIGNIVTRDELMTDLWNNEEYINDNALTVNISRLRSKLTEFGYVDAIETRKGQGYILL